MKLRLTTDQHRTDITVIPMVNVVFLLLIFFMLVGRVTPTEGLRVNPPVSDTGEVQIGRPVSLVLAADGRMSLDGTPVDTTGLIIKAAEIIQAVPDEAFQLTADASLDANRLIQVMEILRRVGVKELSLLIEVER